MSAVAPSPGRQIPWLAGGLALAFAVPFVFADLIHVQRDVYYAIYVVVVLAFVAAWTRRTQPPLRRIVARHWRWAVVLGALAGAVLMFTVLREPATGHPDGAAFVLAILWRGVVYGAADGVLLSVFPVLAVFAAFAWKPLRERSKRAVVGIGALAVACSLVFTAAYHVGYPDFRSGKVAKPLTGDVIWSLPTLVTLNPVGAPLAHIALHVSAVAHSYNTDLFLPPHRSAAGYLTFVPTAGATRTVVHVYFLHGEHGVAVHRAAPARTPATAAVRALLRGPTAVERSRGLTSALPTNVELRGLTVRHGTATVDLSRRFASGGGSASMFGRLGQLVYTLDAVPNVDRVNLWIEGRLVRVFSGEGLILTQPLTPSSFAEFTR